MRVRFATAGIIVLALATGCIYFGSKPVKLQISPVVYPWYQVMTGILIRSKDGHARKGGKDEEVGRLVITNNYTAKIDLSGMPTLVWALQGQVFDGQVRLFLNEKPLAAKTPFFDPAPPVAIFQEWLILNNPSPIFPATVILEPNESAVLSIRAGVKDTQAEVVSCIPRFDTRVFNQASYQHELRKIQTLSIYSIE